MPPPPHSTPLPPLPAALPEELVEEILLRFPPGEPESLFSAALVCKPWCLLISGPRFRRRFRERHRTPPMLGFCCNTGYKGARFLPTTAFRPPGGIRYAWKALDARHGRVLGRRYVLREDDDALIVWDPITDEQLELMKDSPEVDAGWTQSRVIDLRTVLPHDCFCTSPDVVAVMDGLGTLFMMVESGLYTIDLKTCMAELYQGQDIGIKYIIVPYMSFYTPELEAACIGEEPSADGSSA